MKKSTYATPTVTVRGDVTENTLGFKFVGCTERTGRFTPGCDPAAISFGL
jgi:hypothetical protein